MSQSIALGNVGEVNFNGSTVKKINLNGSKIWEKTAVMLYGGKDYVAEACSIPFDMHGFDPNNGSMSDTTPANVSGTIQALKVDVTQYITLLKIKLAFNHQNHTVQAFNTMNLSGYVFEVETPTPWSNGTGGGDGSDGFYSTQTIDGYVWYNWYLKLNGVTSPMGSYTAFAGMSSNQIIIALLGGINGNTTSEVSFT